MAFFRFEVRHPISIQLVEYTDKAFSSVADTDPTCRSSAEFETNSIKVLVSQILEALEGKENSDFD